MKSDGAAWLSIVIAMMIIVVGVFGQVSSITLGVGPLANCPTPVSGSNILCSVGDGLYMSTNGQGYAKVRGRISAAQMPQTMACSVVQSGSTWTISGCQ